MADVDYYEFQWSSDGGLTWQDMPEASAGAFARTYVDFSTTPVSFYHPLFSATPPTDGRFVFPTLQHYEATHPPANWGPGGDRLWVGPTKFYLMNWRTNAADWTDGTYRLRVRGWDWDDAAGKLVNSRILNVCGSETDSEIVLTLDNRLVGGASGHPASTPDHPAGPGTVHTQTLEPDTDFVSVAILHEDGTTTSVGACGSVPITHNDKLRVDFLAHDPAGHLGYYTLQATYGENQAINILALPGVTLMPSPGSPIAASQVGPSYALARSAAPPPDGGAVAPIWHGGALRLEVSASDVFPITCCYQLELRAHKRTIVNCDGSLWGHTNYSEYSFLVEV